MPNPYDTAMGAPMDAAKMKAAADMLRRQETFATIGQLSGDPVLGQFGSGVMERTTGKRKSLRKAMESARKRKDCKPSGMPGQIICDGKLQEVPGHFERVAKQKRLDNEAKMARARVMGGNSLQNAIARRADRRQYMQPSEWGKVSDSLSQIEALGRTIPEVASMEEGDITWPKADIAADWASSAGLGGVVRAIEPVYRTDSARSTRTKIKKVINAIRHSEFGAALTAMEKPEFAAVDPLASGLTKDAMLQRLMDLVEGVTRTARIKIGNRLGPGGEVMPEWLAEGYQWQQAGGAPPAPQVTPGQMPQVPEAGAGRTITPDQMAPGPAAPPQRTPQTMPQRPEGITDEEWQQYLQLEGIIGG